MTKTQKESAPLTAAQLPEQDDAPNDAPPVQSEDGPESFEQDASLVSQELPRVVLGERSSQEQQIRERVLPGRISLTPFGWAMTLPIVTSAALALWFAWWHAGEWSFWMVLLAWSLVWLWKWLYMEAWTYQRTLLKYLSAFMYFIMALGLAFICNDRAPAQEVWLEGTLAERASSTSLLFTAALLLASCAVLLAHLVWFGRGWRIKKSRPRG